MMRISWIDYLKAIGIFLVVYGHTAGVLPFMEKWIYSFHMPLFFLVSGFLMKPNRLEGSFKTFFIRSTKSLMPPYIIFSIICYLFWLLIARNFGMDKELEAAPIFPLLAILYGTSSHATIQLTPIVLWYFPCLYLAKLLSYAAFKPPKTYLCIIFSALLLAIGLVIPRNIVLPFELEDALIAQFFIVLGFLAKKKNITQYFFSHKPYIWGAIFLVTGSIAAMLNGRIDMRSSVYSNFAYFMCSSLGITLGLAILCAQLPKCKPAEIVSKNTIIIFPLHFLVFSFFSAVYVYVFHNLELRILPSVSFFSSIANILLLISISPIIKKVLPWAYGIKSETALSKII
ncbi:MAG: acyltransferase family protein [Kiritimatiellae bacterium]|jgi:acyltransferase|nr:acyltransferase family protein [Kiritimatiellia bacterium]